MTRTTSGAGRPAVPISTVLVGVGLGVEAGLGAGVGVGEGVEIGAGGRVGVALTALEAEPVFTELIAETLKE